MRLAIQDEAEWFRRYGLRGEPHYGADSYANREEAKERVRAQEEYQRTIHARFFREEEEEGSTFGAGGLNAKPNARTAQLQAWANQVVELRGSPLEPSTSGHPDQDKHNHKHIIRVNLQYLASHSDTVYTMAQSRIHFQRHHHQQQIEQLPKDPPADPTDPPASPALQSMCSSTIPENTKEVLVVSLDEYSVEAIHVLLELLDDGDPLACLHEEQVVEVCRLAHYLQCTVLLDETLTPLLVKSVDSSNCMSLCQLADSLEIPALLEASCHHMMRSLGSLEQHEVWGDLTPELKDRIQTIRKLLESRNSKILFFSSFDEYLALFAEQVDYYRERLEDAQRSQERLAQAASQQPATGRAVRLAARGPSQKAWDYAQSKIDEQKERVKVLKLVLQEQKKLFRGKNL